MKYIFLLLAFQISITMSSQEKPTLIYIGDPMCSWCYGFGPEMDEALIKLEGRVDLVMVMGGLRPYNKETMLDLKDFLTHHWEDVHRASNQPFNYGILDTDLYYDTEPASRAVMIVREMAADQAWAYFHKVQHAFYEHNHNPLLTETFSDIAAAMGLDEKEFSAKFESEAYKVKMKDDFLRASQLGVRSFPTVMISHLGKTEIIAQGYTKSANLISKVEALLVK